MSFTKPSEEWLIKMAYLEDGKCVSDGGLACELGMTVNIPEDDGNDPCEVERWIHQGAPLPDDKVFANCVKWLVDDWLHYRGNGQEIVASSFRERLAEVVESMKRLE